MQLVGRQDFEDTAKGNLLLLEFLTLLLRFKSFASDKS